MLGVKTSVISGTITKAKNLKDSFLRKMDESFSGRCMTAGYKNNGGSKTFTYDESGDCDSKISVSDNDYIFFNAVDFTDTYEIEARIKSENGPNYIDIHIGSTTGTLIGTLTVPNSNSQWINIKTNIKKINGNNDIYLIFKGTNKSYSDYLFYFLGWTLVTSSNQEMISAASFTISSTGISTPCCINGNQVQFIQKDTYIVFQDVIFTDAIAIDIRIWAKYSEVTLNSYIEFRVDTFDGELIGKLNISATSTTGYFDVYEIQRIEIKPIFGQRNLYMIFKCDINSGDEDLFHLEAWRIEYIKNCMVNPLSYDGASDGIWPSLGNIGYTKDGYYILYKDIDFTDAISIDIRSSCDTGPNYLDIYIDSLNGILIGIFEVINSFSTFTPTTYRTKIVETSGRHDLYFIIRAPNPQSNGFAYDIWGWELVLK
jgi:hypothetical protein